MIRSLYEIVTFSKAQPVSNRRLFFRVVGGPSSLGAEYTSLVSETNRKAGFLRKTASGWEIEEADTADVPAGTVTSGPGAHSYNHDAAGGVLLVSGPMQSKLHETFFSRRADALKYPIPARRWEEFCSDEQLTKFQRATYRKGIPPTRANDGEPVDGEPVYFILDPASSVVDFFGRAQLFRWPYDLTPDDLARKHQALEGLDMAEALFGTVREPQAGRTEEDDSDEESKDSGFAVASRLRFGDLIHEGTNALEGEMVPQILGSPQPSSPQLYLVQNSDRPENLRSYFRKDEAFTTIRGHKVYWHRWDHAGLAAVHGDRTVAQVRAHPDQHKQHAIIQPVRAGRDFEGTIHFTNLAPEELDALMKVLQLPNDGNDPNDPSHAHKLGMAKPLGLGSIRLETKVRLDSPPRARYTSWGETPASPAPWTSDGSFRDRLVQHCLASQEPLIGDSNEPVRWAEVFRTLQWRERPPRQATQYQPFPNGFRARKVLPCPDGVHGSAIRLDPPAPVQAKETVHLSPPPPPSPPEPEIWEAILLHDPGTGEIRAERPEGKAFARDQPERSILAERIKGFDEANQKKLKKGRLKVRATVEVGGGYAKLRSFDLL